MKKILILVVIFLCFYQVIFSQSGNVPSWVREIPQSNDLNVFFVGKSERSGNYANYLEAKAGALMDVLIQFAAFKGMDVNSILETYHVVSGESLEVLDSFMFHSRVMFNINSAGLYQRDEWMSPDGTLYTLYAYFIKEQDRVSGTLAGNINIPDFYGNFRRENNRIYFSAMSVFSSENLEILEKMTENNAKIQVYLYLGADVRGNLSMHAQSSTNNESIDFLQATLQCSTRVNLQNLSFRKDAQYIQRGSDGKIYFYGLYSINNVQPRIETENIFYTYYINQENINKIFLKNVDFNGNIFIQDKPYLIGRNNSFLQRKTTIEIDNIIRNIRFTNNNENIIFAGFNNNESIEVQNLRVLMHALFEAATFMGTNIKDMIAEYFSEDTNNMSISSISSITGRTSSTKISNLIKIREELAIDGALYQIWSLPRPIELK